MKMIRVFIKFFSKLIGMLPFNFKEVIINFYLIHLPIDFVLWIARIRGIGYFEKYIPKPGDVVIDAGGYRGIISIISSRLVGRGGKIITLEPMTEAYNKIKARVDKLGLENIIVLNKGLYNRKENVKVFFDRLGQAYIDEEHSHGNAEQFYKGNVTIECDRLDNVLKDFKIGRVDFIKMDIEGFELEALSGATECIKKHSPVWTIASYHIRNGEKTFHRVEKFLAGFGYNVLTEDKFQIITYAWKEH